MEMRKTIPASIDREWLNYILGRVVKHSDEFSSELTQLASAQLAELPANTTPERLQFHYTPTPDFLEESSERIRKFKIVRAYAEHILAEKRVAEFSELAVALNEHGFAYNAAGGRGVAKLVSATWSYSNYELGEGEENRVKYAFVDANGNYAYANY